MRLADARPAVRALALRGPDTDVVDLAGQTLIPGFVDAHAPIWKVGHLLTTLLDEFIPVVATIGTDADGQADGDGQEGLGLGRGDHLPHRVDHQRRGWRRAPRWPEHRGHQSAKADFV